MAVFIVLWPYLLTTKLKSVICHNLGHSNLGASSKLNSHFKFTIKKIHLVGEYTDAGLKVSYMWLIFPSNHWNCKYLFVINSLLKCLLGIGFVVWQSMESLALSTQVSVTSHLEQDLAELIGCRFLLIMPCGVKTFQVFGQP